MELQHLDPTEQSDREQIRINRLQQNPELVSELLQEHKQNMKQTSQLGLRRLGPGLKITIWSLRLYVLFMLIVVIMNIMQTLHGS